MAGIYAVAYEFNGAWRVKVGMTVKDVVKYVESSYKRLSRQALLFAVDCESVVARDIEKWSHFVLRDHLVSGREDFSPFGIQKFLSDLRWCIEGYVCKDADNNVLSLDPLQFDKHVRIKHLREKMLNPPRLEETIDEGWWHIDFDVVFHEPTPWPVVTNLQGANA